MPLTPAGRRSLGFVLCALLLSNRAAPAGAGDSFERLESVWTGLHDYSVTIQEREVLGTQSSEHVLHYAFQKPSRARVDVISGTKSGTTIVWNGGDRVIAYRRNLSFFKKHGGVRDRDLTSLRGNSILSADLGDIVACFGEHRAALIERDGPSIEDEATEEVALPYTGVSCQDDSESDRAVTLDVLDLSRRTGLILMRTRYEGDEVVERWLLSDYRIDPGLTDADLQ